MEDYFQTIAQPTEGIYKEKGSKFLAFAYPVSTTGQALERVEALRKAHHKARHHCFAWRLGTRGDQYRASDDGEPGGTAGRPILGQIDKLDLTNVVVIVVRYFGGTLLGTSGLIRAYRSAAADALAQAEIIRRAIVVPYALQFSYEWMSPVMAAIKQLAWPVTRQDFTDAGLVHIDVPAREEARHMLRLKALILQVPESQAATTDWPAGLRVERLPDSGPSHNAKS